MTTPSFRSKVQRLLKERGKSQAMLAEYIGLSKSHLSRVLRGERPAERELLGRLAEFFDMSLDELVIETEHDYSAGAGRSTLEAESRAHTEAIKRTKAAVERNRRYVDFMESMLTKPELFSLRRR